MESTVLVKAFTLLEATANAPRALPLGELARQVGLNKPTAHRILKTLTSLGYVEKSSFGHYRQTSRMRRLFGVEKDEQLIGAAIDALRRLHAKTQETVNLGCLRSNRITYLQVFESPQPLRRVATPNSIDPFHSTALGRAIVAFLSEPQQRLLLRSTELEARTPHTITSPKALVAELKVVAKQGFAIERDQTDLGVTCIGAPVFEDGIPVAAVSVSLPSARAGVKAEKALIAAVQTTCKQIERELAKLKGSY